MTQGRSKNGAELKNLVKQVRKARHLVQQSELKVAAIVATIYEMEKFYPKIKIIRRPDKAGKNGFNLFAENVLARAA